MESKDKPMMDDDDPKDTRMATNPRRYRIRTIIKATDAATTKKKVCYVGIPIRRYY